MNAQVFNPGSTTYVKRSFAPTHRLFITPSGTGHQMRYGDRVYVRLIMSGRTVCEFTTVSANDLSEVLGMLRVQTRGLEGLGNLYVRNISRGWSIDRPLKLYGDRSALRRRQSGPTLFGHPVYSPLPCGVAASASAPAHHCSGDRMLMPWETH